MLTPNQVTGFQSFLTWYFKHYGRHDLPWRQGFDPYHVLVSEIMLQQTQVDRVIPKFEAFLEAFPTVSALATATPAAVIRQWQGLGYNRRGLNLHKAAQTIINDFDGQVPSTLPELLKLPGIGPYTAAAIQAFAFNLPTTVIETNIRTVYIYHFFPSAYDVTDADLQPLIEQTLDTKSPRQWYSALMDYGTYLKQVVPNPTRKSKHYVKQSTFKGSNRQLRGLILKLASQGTITTASIQSHSDKSVAEINQVIETLIKEGFIKQEGNAITLIE